MKYQKLFPIEYDNKKYMLFLNEKNKLSFLELNSKGEYEYPSLEDYISLYRIFNLKNKYICNEVQHVTFKEKVKVVKSGILSLLTIVVITNSIPTAAAQELKVTTNDTTVTLTEEELKEITNVLSQFAQEYHSKHKIISNVDDIELYLGKVDLNHNTIINAINSNESIPDYIKLIAQEEATTLLNKYPTINLRVFYENIKRLNVKTYTDEEYINTFPNMPGSAAHYDVKKNTIHIRDNASIEIIRHELAHTFHNIWLENDGIIIYRIEKHHALDEGMTDRFIELFGRVTNKGSYKISKNIIEFLMEYAEFTFEEYNQYGLNYLMNKASQKYPDIDFNYISQTLNAMSNAEIYNKKVTILEDSKEMLDELFKICLKNINKENGYKPFQYFVRILSNSKNTDLYYEYLEKYNIELKKIGYKNIIDSRKVKEDLKIYALSKGLGYTTYDKLIINPVIYKDGNIYLINKDGTTTLTPNNFSYVPINNFANIILCNYLQDMEHFNTQDFWKKIAIDSGVKSCILEEIPIYMNGKLISSELISQLYIQVGVTENNEIGYIIKKEETVIYQSNESLSNISNSIPLYHCYIPELELNQLNLETILNEEYLISVINRFPYFKNVMLENDRIVFVPLTSDQSMESKGR